MRLIWWIQAQIVWALAKLPEDFFDVSWEDDDDEV